LAVVFSGGDSSTYKHRSCGLLDQPERFTLCRSCGERRALTEKTLTEKQVTQEKKQRETNHPGKTKKTSPDLFQNSALAVVRHFSK
jgi:hypothetical protein